MKKVSLVFTFVTLFVSACTTNTYESQPVEVYSDSYSYYSHVVSHRGETLGIISSWYTGSSSNWQDILSYNSGLDVYHINIGDVILIPDHLLVRSEQMPSSYVRKLSNNVATERVYTSPKEEEVEVVNVPSLPQYNSEELTQKEKQIFVEKTKSDKLLEPASDLKINKPKSSREIYLQNMLKGNR